MFPVFRHKRKAVPKMLNLSNFLWQRSLWLLGGLSLLAYLGMAWLSREFIYGQGHVQRPIGLFVAGYLTLWVFSMLALRRVRQSPHDRFDVWAILSFAVLFRLPLLFSQPIQEDDFYRYLWDGKVVASGLNPYIVAPLTARDPSESDEKSQRFAHLAQQDENMAQILARVNHPHVPTIYPPVAEGVFALTAWLAPGSLLAWRLVLLGFDLAVCIVVMAILRHCASNMLLVVVYAWSPLVIKETVNSAHYDVVPTFFLALALWCTLKDKLMPAYASLALAILGKLYPVLLLPVFLWRTVRLHGRRQALCGFAVVCTVVILGYVPFLAAGSMLWQGALAFADHWQSNSLLFPLLAWLTGERWMANTAVVLLLGCTVLALLRMHDVRVEREFLWVNFLAVGALFLLSPVGNPWYFLWIMPFLCVFPLRSWLLLSGLLGLYYLWFSFVYRGTAETFRWIIWLEYVPFYVMLLWEASVRTLGGKETVNSQQPAVRQSAKGGPMKFLLAVLSAVLLGNTLSYGQTRDWPTLATPLLVVPEAKEVHIFGIIYPARFNAAQGDEAHYHLLVWQGGQSANTLIETPADDLAFHAALTSLGAQPGDNLTMASWNERLKVQSPEPFKKVSGSLLDVSIAWANNAVGIPVSQIFRQPPIPNSQPRVEWRFGGNRDRWFNRVPLAPRPGCLACLYSCPSGKVSNGALSVHDYVETPARFVVDTTLLPPDGAPVIVTFRVLPPSP
jgi:hypothetical protein